MARLSRSGSIGKVWAQAPGRTPWRAWRLGWRWAEYRASARHPISARYAAQVHVIHVDDHLIVVDKPAGLLAVPGRTEPDCAAARVQARWPDARVVHRLDMATSGLLALARGLPAQRQLSQAFATRGVGKRYLAVVHGLPAEDAGEIDLPLGADWPDRPRQRVDRVSGKPALTRWRVLARDDTTGQARLALEPVTGRSHQLRVHLLAIGHPIVGDRLYGPAAVDPGPRLMLHADRLDLPHPGDGRRVAFDCDAPF
jgi:tRNA pseudouridine32 synthase/23S rRNA pseudouridine746 synthase